MSYAFNQLGHKISFTEGKTSSGANNDWYYYRVADIDAFISRTYGPYTSTTLDAIKGRTGIIWQSDCDWDDATGHIDVWNGSKSILKYYPECKYVYFWELK